MLEHLDTAALDASLQVKLAPAADEIVSQGVV
jgi:hypothetical protein